MPLPDLDDLDNFIVRAPRSSFSRIAIHYTGTEDSDAQGLIRSLAAMLSINERLDGDSVIKLYLQTPSVRRYYIII